MTAQQTAAPAAPVPVLASERVHALLVTLIGQEVEVTPASPVIPRQDLAAVSVYVTDGGQTGAVAAWDLSLAASAGAALAQAPLTDVHAAVATRELAGDLADGFAEVANVLVSALNDNPDAPQLQLHELHAVGEELSAEVITMLRYVVRRVDLQVDIAGYGGGRLSVVAIG